MLSRLFNIRSTCSVFRVFVVLVFYCFSVIVAIGIPYLYVATWTVIYNATHLMVDDDDNYANAFAIAT